ncbi:MAG: ATP-binding protein [Candidatus Micrarchaeota archaeon]
MANANSPLGTVISTMESPNTLEFAFVIQSSDVHKSQFVQVPSSPHGPVLGTISEIYRANRYFERPESVAEYSRLGMINSHFPTSEWEYMVAKVKVHGVLKENFLSRSSIPVKCGADVLPAEEGQLKSFLALDENGLELGKLRYHKLSITLSLSKLLQKHLAILAMSGSGKSYLAGVLIEELLDRDAEKGRIAIIAIDNHGEYIGFKDSAYRGQVNVIDGKKIKIGLRHLTAWHLAEWSKMSAVAMRALDTHFAELKTKIKSTGEPLGLKELIDTVQEDPSLNKKENVRGPLLSSLYELARLRLIGKADTIKSDSIKPGTLTVIDLSPIDDLRKKQMIVAHYGRKFFKQRKKEAIPPFLMLVEEAHNFCPEKMEKSSALSRGIINTIAREGRKFGASLCLISQRPVQLSTTALSQCNSNIILRVTNPYDLDHIKESCEGIDRTTADAITTLRVGEALIIGEAVGAPVFVNIRKRKSKTKTKGEPLEKLAKEFEEKNKIKEEEIEAFL